MIRQLIHESDESGTRCGRCGVALVGPRERFRFDLGDRVVLRDLKSPEATWRTPLAANCSRRSET